MQSIEWTDCVCVSNNETATKKTGGVTAALMLMQNQPGSGSVEFGVAGTPHYKVLHLL